MRFLKARQSALIALTLAVLLAGWLLSGQLGAAGPAEPEAADSNATERPAMSVRVREFESRPVTREVVFSGRTAPARKATLRAEAEGRVVELAVERGARVEAGAVIARLDGRDREARLTEAQATLNQRQLEYDGARRLGERGLQAETQIAQARAALDQARARLRQVEVELDHTVLRAPFAGVLDRRMVELGDFVGIGDTVAELLELDPLIVTGTVSQDQVGRLQVGSTARARLLSGRELDGTIRYIASAADDATRTFEVELEVANPGAAMPAGVSAEIRIPTDTIRAHYLSPALLALGDAGELGVKTVNGDGTVVFHPVEIVQATPGGFWLTGLPERARVITVGQGFVHDGQRVDAVPEQAVAAHPVSARGGGRPGDRS